MEMIEKSVILDKLYDLNVFLNFLQKTTACMNQFLAYNVNKLPLFILGQYATYSTFPT